MDMLIDDRALDDEEDDESFDEETGEVRKKTNGENKHFDDSSEEEDDDDDEEAAAEVAKGFIVDEDEELDEDAKAERRRERKKRRREEREDEGLDEEDLELIGMKPVQEASEPKFKRLKRGPREDEERRPVGVTDIFADEDEEEVQDYTQRPNRYDRRGPQDEFDDFIEEDVFSDDEQARQQEDMEVARPNRRGMPDLLGADVSGLDEEALQDFRAAFGDGTDYDFALEKEEQAEEDRAKRDKQLNLKDVFEPSQLKEKLLTDEDTEIRMTDEPERHQIARLPYKNIELTDDEFKEESLWISNYMLARREEISSSLREPFQKCVAQILEFLVRDDFEVQFIWTNRKDYLIYVTQNTVGRNQDGTPHIVTSLEKLLDDKDLWTIYDLDLQFRGLIEKRRSLSKKYEELKTTNIAPDEMFEELLPQAISMNELQDMQDYLYFQYAAELKDLALTANGTTNGAGMSRKRAATQSVYEVARTSKAYNVVRAFGITANAFAQNIAKQGIKTHAEDPDEDPENLADSMVDENFVTGSQVLELAKKMFVQELVMNPRFRKVMRNMVFANGVIDCIRTEKGLRRIDESSDDYEFKYLRNAEFADFGQSGDPALYLRMLRAEEDELVRVKVRLRNHDTYKKQLIKHIETDNYSTVADAWNKARQEVVSEALDKVMDIMGRFVKEFLKHECEDKISAEARKVFQKRLDQAPYQPRGMKKGTTPRALTLTNGNGIPGRDPVYYAYVNDEGRVVENGKFVELAPGDRERELPDGKDVRAFVDLVRRREPEVIGIAGMSPETRKIHKYISDIVKDHDLRGPTFDEHDRDSNEHLEVVIVNDEVARIYQTSERAQRDHPGFPQLTHYCVALAKYLQDPLKEYAALGKDIVSISFDPAQGFLPEDKLLKKLEQAFVDIVNMVGVDLNEAPGDPATANLLPYVAGLGPRKAQHLLKVMNVNGGFVGSRAELLGVGTNEVHAALTGKVWANAASFLNIPFDTADETSEYLDATRIHPEDYDIARKMAADALELDEEDIEEERRMHGSGAIVRRLVKEEAQDRVNDLVLEEYADQLERNLHTKKRTTLENIRAELIEPSEEIRREYNDRLSDEQTFTMFTGEKPENIAEGMNVPIKLKRITDTYVEGLLECGLVAIVTEAPWDDDSAVANPISPKQLYTMHQTVQAHILKVDRKAFTVEVSLRDEAIKKPYRKFDPSSRSYNEWDDRQEAADRKLLSEKSDTGMRATRVIKHPMFHPFNKVQAESYLGNQNRGDVVIRPSGKGNEHLTITWKVADGLFQHIDVLELMKENEFALGRKLKVGTAQYSDLDELLDRHVSQMARKVQELMNHEKFQDKSRKDVGMFTIPFASSSIVDPY